MLVGHSLGGFLVQVYARRYPNEIAGLILVDSVHPDQARRLVGITPDLYYPALIMAPLGIQRLLIAGGAPRAFSPEVWAGRQAVLARSSNIRGLGYEVHAFLTASGDDTLTKPFEAAPPLIVLTHGDPLPGMPPEKSAAVEKEWRRMQIELAAFSSRGTQRIVPHSSHFIPFDQPDAIVDAVKEVLAQTADKKTSG